MLISLASIAISLTLLLTYFAYTRSQRREDLALHLRLYASPVTVPDGLSISLYTVMKSGRVIVGARRLFRTMGISEVELHYLMPILLYLEGCVYAGDQETEARYRGEACSGTSRWVYSMVEAARGLGILDPALEADVKRLGDYYAAEAALMRREAPLSDEALFDINMGRSFDCKIMIRAAMNLLRRPLPERRLALFDPVFALAEIADDIGSYEKDLRDGSFNTLGLLVQLHSRAGATPALGRLFDTLAGELKRRLRQAERRDVAHFLAFLWYGRSGVSMGLLIALASLLPKRIMIRAALKANDTLCSRLLDDLPHVGT